MPNRTLLLLLFAIHYSLFTIHSLSAATLKIENVTRLKGQEATTIIGYGIVSGLNGTGDDPKSYDQTARTILKMFELGGLPNGSLKSVGTSKNNALVEVSATIPETGGRDGDRLDVTIASVGNAKSLENGVLSATMLTSAVPQSPELAEALGMAWGKITIENTAAKNVGKIQNGCRLTDDFINPYVKEGNVTLVIKEEYSDPRMAVYVAESINKYWNDNLPDAGVSRSRRSADAGAIAKAINAHFVVVKLPREYYNNPLYFVSELQGVEITMANPLVPRVVINERSGIISIDENVEVKPVVVTHKNIVAEIRPPVPPGEQEVNPQQFVDIDTETKYAQFQGQPVVNQKLKALQASLDAARVPPQDFIEIIKTLHRQGAIVGDVIYVE
ncbi:MAG: flagellar basal body P-ring protein FlgI [Planctomycetaceae bacterium]|jgi:flagellar P-ring protein precursor FlgI|nr:flagellar basal body P-ring protein FlgI [Planctomycetaceae bacterium]